LSYLLLEGKIPRQVFKFCEQNISGLDNMSLVSTEPDWGASAKISLHDIENHYRNFCIVGYVKKDQFLKRNAMHLEVSSSAKTFQAIARSYVTGRPILDIRTPAGRYAYPCHIHTIYDRKVDISHLEFCMPRWTQQLLATEKVFLLDSCDYDLAPKLFNNRQEALMS